ncbi:hypothetical protein D521_0657 [beta proteobacterium CB]|nr:hypothetical protein D521_0657 [beta proteobacterium CB]
MADKTSNAPTPQQVNDAQCLDSMTSLQQLSVVEQNFLIRGLSYPSLDASLQNLESSLAFFSSDIVAWTMTGEESSPNARCISLWL